MVAKPLYSNLGKRKGVVLYPHWECDNKLPPSSLMSVTDFIDRASGPSYGDGPVFIAHHNADAVFRPPESDGYHLYSGYVAGGYWVFGSDTVVSADSHSFFETRPEKNLEFEYVGWLIHGDTLYEFSLQGKNLAYGGTYTGQYSYDRLQNCIVYRFKSWNSQRYLTRTSRARDYCEWLGGSWGYPKTSSIWVDALKSGSLETIYSRLCDICTHEDSYNWGGSLPSTIGVIGLGSPMPEPHDLGSFVFPKSQYYYWASRIMELPGSVSNGINTAFFSDAYYKAVDKLPKLKQNLLANILDIVASLKSFKNGYKAIYSAKDLAASSWLAYRYAYSTTVSDLEEATNYLGRLYYLLETEATVVRSYGTHHDDGAVYYCALECDFGALMSASLSEKLDKQYNLRLSATNVWDMIPYSFVVDWFLGIGDVLEEIDRWLDSASIPVTNIWYSYKEDYVTPTGSESVYFRWNGKAPKLPYFTELYDSKSTSSVTLFKRGLDTLALIF